MPKRNLRIVVWNCNQAFHKKHAYLLQRLRPDVALIPECAHPEVLRVRGIGLKPETFEWYGQNRQKGLGVFTYGDYRISKDLRIDPVHKWILPVSIVGPHCFNLIAVWARYHEAKRSGAPGPVLNFIAENQELLKSGSTLMAGDFNSSIALDRATKVHSRILVQLASLGLMSAYHAQFQVDQGKEVHPTIYWRDRSKNSKRNYHIDYCFVPNSWGPKIMSVEVGTFEEWIKLSDHSPLLFEFEV